MDEKIISLPHTLYIDNRNKLVLTGVTDVGSFNEENLQIITSLGEISVGGENLQVTKLSLESGEMTVEGRIISVAYSDSLKKGSGFFGRVFG
ncbi:MAG: sporulation protein YabP [Oscillospiraceae bacterium]|nr:sporulation protein YabP [Oscillospiraceae bacterium]